MRIVAEWWHSRLRVATLLIAMAAVAGYEVARAFYRPYIYSRHIDDLHIADTLGNSLGTVATAFAFTSVFGRDFARGLFVLRNAVIGVVVYELLHPLLGKRIDPWDITATLIAGATSEVIFRRLHRRLSPKAEPEVGREGRG